MFDGACAGAVHRDDHARRRSGTWRPVLLGARAPVAAQLHVQVQGDGRRGPATPVVARVPQRVASRRSPATVSRSACSLHTLASTPPGMSGTYPPQYFGRGDVNGNIPPISLRTFGYSRPILVALRSLSLKPISFGYKTPSTRFSQAGGQSAHKARPPTTLNSR